MRLRISVFVMGLLLALGAVTARAQNGQNVPLGTIARELRKEAAEKKPAHPVKLFTNDNIPRSSDFGPAPSEAKPSSAATEKPKTALKPSTTEHGKAYFHSKMENLRAQLALHQRELAVLKQKLSQTGLEYNGSPQKELMQQSGPRFYSDQNKIKQEITAKETQIAADHQAMDDLTTELRRDGGDPGWIR